MVSLHFWRRAAPLTVALASLACQPGHAAGIDAACVAVPAVPPVAANALKVTDFGAKPDDDGDDTAAIQKALAALKPGMTLVFPPGRYLHNDVLRVTTPGVTLHGEGATLLGTNPERVALMISADDVGVYGFRLSATTNIRKTFPEAARIAVIKVDGAGQKPSVQRVRIQNNLIVPAGEPDTPLANSSSSSGIILYNARSFVVAGNRIERSLADGIYMTGGSRDGLVTQNTVRETGDDLISVVSFGGGAIDTRKPDAEVRAAVDKFVKARGGNITIYKNDVGGNYWGRGITVVGGSDVTIADNKIDRVAGGAGILISRELSYKTLGVDNVLIENNVIEKIQNTPPVYNPGKKFNGSMTKQAGIEIQSFMFDDESGNAAARDAFAVRDIAVLGNTVRDSGVGGIRLGLVMRGASPDGGRGLRSYSSGAVANVRVEGNHVAGLGYGVAVLGNADKSSVSCNANEGGKSGDCAGLDLPQVVGASWCATSVFKR